MNLQPAVPPDSARQLGLRHLRAWLLGEDTRQEALYERHPCGYVTPASLRQGSEEVKFRQGQGLKLGRVEPRVEFLA